MPRLTPTATCVRTPPSRCASGTPSVRAHRSQAAASSMAFAIGLPRKPLNLSIMAWGLAKLWPSTAGRNSSLSRFSAPVTVSSRNIGASSITPSPSPTSPFAPCSTISGTVLAVCTPKLVSKRNLSGSLRRNISARVMCRASVMAHDRASDYLHFNANSMLPTGAKGRPFFRPAVSLLSSGRYRMRVTSKLGGVPITAVSRTFAPGVT